MDKYLSYAQASKSNKKAVKTYERPGLSEEEIGEIKEAFNLFDTDGSGIMSGIIHIAGLLSEIQSMLTTLNTFT
jgi:Ca2+-binding EF-hand superfamily protein